MVSILFLPICGLHQAGSRAAPLHTSASVWSAQLSSVRFIRQCTLHHAVHTAVALEAGLSGLVISRRMRCLFALVVQHRVDDSNTDDMHFDFTEENYERVRTILGKYPTNYKQSGILPLLDLAQRQVRCL